MADSTAVILNEEHAPKDNAVEAFLQIDAKVKAEWIKLRHHWDSHEPRMFSRAQGLSDGDFAGWDIQKDLVSIRAGPTAYGTLIFGKIRIPAVEDGFVHVRIHDPPQRGTQDVVFHSFFTDEQRDGEGKIVDYIGIQKADSPIEFFNE